MAAPVIDGIDFAGNVVTVRAHGGNGTLFYRASVNRGTLPRVATGVVTALGNKGRGPGPTPMWTWTDNWTIPVAQGGAGGQGQGPPLYIEARVRDSDGRFGFAYTSTVISASPLTTYQAVAPSGGDDSAALSSLNLAGGGTCPDHAIYQLQTGATYIVSSQWALDQRTDITIDLNGATLVRDVCQNGQLGRGILEFTRSTAMIVKNGSITGHYISGVCSSVLNDITHGIRINGSTHCYATGITFSNITGDNLYVSRYLNNQTPDPEFFTGENCANNTHSDRQGYTVVTTVPFTTSGAWFVNCSAVDHRWALLDCETDVSQERISAVRFIGGSGTPAASGSPLVQTSGPGPQNDIIFANVTGLNGNLSGPPGVAVISSDDVWIYNYQSANKCDGPHGCLYLPGPSKGLFIQSCQFTNVQGSRPGAVLSISDNQVRIFDSVFTGASSVYTDDGTGKDIVQAGNTL